jgi:hypothetical protein
MNIGLHILKLEPLTFIMIDQIFSNGLQVHKLWFFGSKSLNRSQMNYLKKGLQVFFFCKINFCMQMNFWKKFFGTCSKKYLNVPQCITCFFISHYWINMIFQKCAYSFNIYLFSKSDDFGNCFPWKILCIVWNHIF